MDKAVITLKVKDHFKDLKFNQEEHTYKVNGKKLISVSGLIKNFTKPFETDLIATRTAKARGISKCEIIAQWDKKRIDACNYGTRVHDFAERYITHKYKLESDLQFHSVYQHLKEGEKLTPKEQAVLDFWEDKPGYYIPIILELKMYSEHWSYAGTADIILLDTRDGYLVIGDYKTNEDLFKQYKNQKLLNEFSYLDDCPYNKYQLQLSFYQILLEQVGFKVSRRFLVWVQEVAGSPLYEIYDTKDYTEQY